MFDRLRPGLALSRTAVAAITLSAATIAGAQQPVPKAQHPPADVIVRGIPDGPYPVTVRPSARPATEAATARRAASDARMLTRCIKSSDNKALRDLIDGPPNRAIRGVALDHIVRSHMACYAGFDPVELFKPNFYGDCVPRGDFLPIYDKKKGLVSVEPLRIICQTFFDRGAIIERILSLYAPDLAFTTDQLLDSPVLARHHAREERFDRTRSKPEQTYAAVVGCLVAVHPDLALAYVRSEVNGDAEARLRSALIGTAPAGCIHGAKDVRVDPAEFRVFVADAIYSWAVALRGTDSLIPAG